MICITIFYFLDLYVFLWVDVIALRLLLLLRPPNVLLLFSLESEFGDSIVVGSLACAAGAALASAAA